MEGFGSFGSVAGSYAVGRQGFPEWVFYALAARLPEAKIVVDAACGNGIPTRQLRKALPRTCRIIGVERDPEMLAQAPATKGIRYVCSSCEEMHKHRIAHADAVTVFSAFHWFAHEQKSVQALANLLVSGGYILVANKDVTCEVVPEFEEIFEKWSGKPVPQAKANYFPKETLESAGFAVQLHSGEVMEEYTLTTAVALLKSKSAWNLIPKKNRANAEEDLSRELRRRVGSDGIIRRQLVVRAYFGIKK